MHATGIGIPTRTIAILTRQWLVWLGLQKILEHSRTVPMVLHKHRCRTGERLFTDTRADVFILDLESDRDALGTIKQLRASAPTSKIVLLCGFEDNACMRDAYGYGVDGILLKVHPPEVVIAVLEALYAPAKVHAVGGLDGETVTNSEAYSRTPVDGETNTQEWSQALTRREREIVQLVRQGLSNKDIAYRLSIRDSTVRHHMTNIFDKVGVSNRQKLMVHTHRLASTRPSSQASHPPIG